VHGIDGGTPAPAGRTRTVPAHYWNYVFNWIAPGSEPKPAARLCVMGPSPGSAGPIRVLASGEGEGGVAAICRDARFKAPHGRQQGAQWERRGGPGKTRTSDLRFDTAVYPALRERRLRTLLRTGSVYSH